MGTPQHQSGWRTVNGVCLLDKPQGISSNLALQKVRRLFQAAKGGHTGVLDPLATGLLPLCFGEATKFCSYLLDADKAYRATVQFGANTTTGDSEGEIILRRTAAFTQETLETVLQTFSGEISQVPPMYSALKYQGKPLYEYARQGIVIERPARQVRIYRIQLVDFDAQRHSAVIEVSCSKGTYIRTLAEDLGEKLGCGAYLTRLRRTLTAGFSIEQSKTLPVLSTMINEQRDETLLPVDILVRHLQLVILDSEKSLRFKRGQKVCISANCGIMENLRIYQNDTCNFLGIGVMHNDGLKPLRLMATL